MDLLLYGGDHYTDARGLPVLLEGAPELMQRALIRLQVRKGAFALDPGLGSELYRLPRRAGERTDRLAMGYVQEALADMPGLVVCSVRCSLEGVDALSVTVWAEAEGEGYVMEVGV